MPRKKKNLAKRRRNPLRAIIDAGSFADAMLTADARLRGRQLERCKFCGADSFSAAIHYLSCTALERARNDPAPAAAAATSVIELKKQKDGTYGEDTET